MTEVYGITKKGIYHEKNDQVCQDFHKILKKGEFVFAAVADGVGSNTHSHIASEIGATESVNYCAEHISPFRESCNRLILNSSQNIQSVTGSPV